MRVMFFHVWPAMKKERNLFIREVSAVFNSAASFYKQNSRVSDEIGRRLMERLDYFKLSPHYILDLGSGVGNFSKRLKQRYPNATVVSFDLSLQMTQIARKQQRFRKRSTFVCGDMHALPFQNKQFDLIFSNQALQWSYDLKDVLGELHRVMQPSGCLLFSMLGPDTMKEANLLLQCAPSMPTLIDMHDVGDAMIEIGFDDPVLDMEMLTVNYKTFDTLTHSLKTQGLSCIKPEKEWPSSLSFEILYGHAWRLLDKQKTVGGETFIPLHFLSKSST